MDFSADRLLHRLLVKGRLRQLQLILSVADLGSTHHAAKACAISQPVVTKSIQEFEELLGLVLFERHAKGMRLTPDGKEIISRVRNVMDAITHLAQAATARKSTESSFVRLAGVAAGINGLLVSALPSFSEIHPQIQTHVVEIEGGQIDEFLQNSDIDLVVCREPSNVPAGWYFTPMMEDEHALFACAGHPLAGKRLKIPDLGNQKWLTPPSNVPAIDTFNHLMTLVKTPKYCQIASRNPALVREALKKTMALAITPESLFKADVEAGVIVKLNFKLNVAISPIGVLSRDKALSSATKQLIDYLAAFSSH